MRRVQGEVAARPLQRSGGRSRIPQAPRAIKRQLQVYTVPDLLLVHLARFKVTTVGRSKVRTAVRFPLRGLDMAMWVSSTQRNGPLLYDLVAVCNHM